MTVGSNQVAVGTLATLLASVPATVGAPGQAGAVELYPDASVDVFLGGAAVTATTGLKLKAGGTVPVTVPLFPGDTLFGVVATGTATVGVLQT
jgi:hypothetical protein